MRIKTPLTQALFARKGEVFSPVELPHTWNAFDGQDGGADYWRGIGTYDIDLPNPTKGKKQYIEIRGANHVATVYCNGRELGTHKGGFSTFRFDLTPAMKAEGNVLTVAVSNAPCDVYPQVADFTFFGGLYRDVNFIEVDPAHFDLMKDGTDAIFVTPHASGKTRLDLFSVNAEGCTIVAELKDAEGNVVVSDSTAAEAHTFMLIDIAEPHHWQGVEDPYCYTATASLVKDGVVLDSVTATYGYRSFRVDAATGFYLNGKSMPLRGTSRHQDRQDKGWAISKADHEEDIEFIKEVGANTLRLAHYQHDQYFYDLCDKAGFILWAEIPFITRFNPSQEAYENTISQMTELVAQNYNHPSICFWGLSNELLIGPDSEALRQNLRDLHKLAKSMDPSRLTTIAQVTSTTLNSEHNFITDVVSYNHYFGWYSGDVSQNGPWLDKFHAVNPDIPIGISEYGTENIVSWHSANPINHDYTEEYGNYYHHEMLKIFETRPYIWATHQWNMFDFAADGRSEGGVHGRNSKGLVTRDRKIKKDAFFIYKAYWNPEPMVHVAGRRFADRAPGERNITVYTNCDEVTLVINGVAVETKKAVDHAIVFENVALNDGPNTITAKAGNVEDTITLNGVAEPNAGYMLPDIMEAMAVGNWFDDINENTDSDVIDVIEGFYSVEDSMAVLFDNEECYKIVRGWLMSHGQLNITTGLPNLRNTMPEMSFRDGIAMYDGAPGLKELAQVNRLLNRIKK